ncbi:MAG TPA: MogA/MoaB family molybdenum cofactor biosynthesis protein [Bellilinea sp.]
MTVHFAILTVSDRSSRGEREDIAGPALRAQVASAGHSIVHTAVVADEFSEITAQLTAWCDSGKVDVILTTGGTGFAPRDVTPEATTAVMQRPAPGIAEAARAFSLKITPHAMLARNTAGIRGRTLIINLPGSPKAAREILEYLLQVLPHAVELLSDDPAAEQGHAKVPG